MKSATKNRHRYPLGAAVGAILILLLIWSDAGTATQRKVVKPPRGAPPPENRTLNMPEAFTWRLAASGQTQRGMVSSKLAPSTTPWTVVREPEHQTPIFLQFDETRSGAAKPAAGVVPHRQVLQFIAEHAALFRLRDPAIELVHRGTHKDKGGRSHVRLEQRHLDVPVWGVAIFGHWSVNEGLYAINGRYLPSPDHITGVQPSITREAAIGRALEDLAQRRSINTLSSKMQELLKYQVPEADLYLWNARLEAPLRLTWHVEIRPNTHERWRFFLDAHTGEILERYQAAPSDGPAVGSGVDLHGNWVNLHTYKKGGLFCLLDGTREGFNAETGRSALLTLDADYTDTEKWQFIFSTDNVFIDPVAVSAHANLSRVYEYFLEHHGRRGIVGNGSGMISLVHVTDNGLPMDNATWNGVFMSYGDGRDAFTPLAGALDVAAHEMTHGIIEHTVNLEYRFQSGALNESFADIFGVMVDDDDWLVGEDIVRNPAYFPSGAMRDLRDPHNGDLPGGYGWQPAHMHEFQDLPIDVDNGGVHVNSGIPNRAAYLVAEAIGREKAARIFYHVLQARYLAPRSQFVDCRLAAVRAARDLFGDGSNEVNAVMRAYDAVGITVEGVTEPTPGEIAVDPGAHWVATAAAEADGDNSLWFVKPTSDAYEMENGWEYIARLTPTQIYTGTGRAITAPMNSDFLIFIDSDNNLRFIGADGSEETVINEEGDWSSIAISPDGSRLVATTLFDEAAIWYFDLETPENNRSIALYQPTTQTGVRQNIARYADALQWDASGTLVIYDVFNSLPGPGGQTIDFWTVNALEPISNTILPLFPPQPEGVQLGNPSLSGATGPDGAINDCRLLYERVDARTARTEIRVKDFCTGREGVLYTFRAPILTHPGFINDDREIVFQVREIEAEFNTAHLFRMPLSDDGFSSAGNPLVFVPYSQYPVTLILSKAASDVIVGAEPRPNPDFDGDGIVGFPDFLQFAARFGLSRDMEEYDARFDLDGDGSIAFSDFLIFAAAFGT